MPTYTYECACGQVWDVRHGMNETPDLECDNCGGTMERVFTPPAITFKGSGFYTTDKKK
jgi:putative FmdB family regulatory protein